MNKPLFPRFNLLLLKKMIASACVLAMALTVAALAQQSAKRPITHSDYDGWRNIQWQQLSRDGKFVAYALVPQDGDGEVVVRNLATGAEWRAPRGAQPPPPVPVPGAAGPPPFQPSSNNLAFTADSRFLIFQIQPAKAETEKAKRAKKKPEDMPKTSLGIMDLSTGQVTTVEKVKSFRVPEEGAGFVAYLLEAKPEAKPEPKAEEKKPEGEQPPAGQRPARREKKKEYGSDLVLRNLADKSERTFADALEYTFSKDGRSLVFAVSSKKEETNGVYAVTPGSADAPATLLAGKGKYTKITWDDKQTQLAFISDRDDAAASQPKFKLYHWDRKSQAANEIASVSTPGFKQGMVISDKGNITFSLDGGEVFFGVAPPPPPEKDESEESTDDKVVADLWHYKDDFIQPMQRIRAERDRNRSYRAVFHLKDKKLVQLADEKMEEVNPSSDGRWAIGADDRPYRLLVGVDANYSDYFLVNTADGNRKPLLTKQQWGLNWSPSGKYALYYDGKDWNTVSVPDGKMTNLTAKLGVSFSDETHDSPSIANSYGSAGWTADDRAVLIYDRYDIWQIAPDGSHSRNLTDGVGRKDLITLRYVRLDPKERWIDPDKSMLLSAESQETRDSGFYREKVNSDALPQKLLMAAKDFNNPTKARDADVLIMTASRFDQFPDIWVTNSTFRELKRVSNGDAQRAAFSWGTGELVSFKNVDGVPLKGLLLKPDNFDPRKKYPMIVYIYERLSQGLHTFRNPGPGTSINPTFYVSNGYLVYMPDIVYTIGYPGHSAMKCVLPGIQSVVDKGFVNENAIGIQGHSWGGYQIAYMVTQTNRFKAAAPGALVANMTSAYSGIRWGTGLPRQFQYERSQSRIGGSLWEYPLRFLDNSPIFRADRVETPLLMLHNDEDDAVPWYQGIEYFLALRRLGKEAYMFNYNGEKHGLRKRINQKDYTRRLQEFFDHFLKGAPAPEWMEKGIPYLQREKEKEKYRTSEDNP
jgi:dipeptidyl aminopeptidase/acylaminoacyl peptidase